MKYFVKVSAIGTYWYKDEEMTILHRENGPAVESSNRDKVYYLNGVIHRIDGPAFERVDGHKVWWLNGIRMTEEEHRQQTQPAIELTVADIEKLLGKKIKIVK